MGVRKSRQGTLHSPRRRLHGQVTADVRGGSQRRWDSFRVGEDPFPMLSAIVELEALIDERSADSRDVR